MITVFCQTTQDHIIGGSPYSAQPVSSVLRVIVRIVRRKRRNAIWPLEFLFVIKVCNERIRALPGDKPRKQRPVSAHRLYPAQISVSAAVVIKRSLFVPHFLIDKLFKHSALIFQPCSFRFSAQQLAHFDQRFSAQPHLCAGIDPRHEPVRTPGIVPLLLPGLVIHAAGVSAAPIPAVRPRTIELQPLMIGKQRIKHACNTLFIARQKVIFPLCPRQYVRACRARIIPRPLLARLFLANFATDIPVLMLMRIEIVQRFVKIEYPATVFPEHNDKSGIPHKKISVKCCIDKVGYKPRLFFCLAQISEREFPSLIVTADDTFMILPNRMRKFVFILFERRQCSTRRLFPDERILFYMFIFCIIQIIVYLK